MAIPDIIGMALASEMLETMQASVPRHHHACNGHRWLSRCCLSPHLAAQIVCFKWHTMSFNCPGNSLSPGRDNLMPSWSYLDSFYAFCGLCEVLPSSIYSVGLEPVVTALLHRST